MCKRGKRAHTPVAPEGARVGGMLAPLARASTSHPPTAHSASPEYHAPARCLMSSDPHPLLLYVPERPPKRRKPPEDLRTHRISVPVSSREYDQITHLSHIHGCSHAELLRNAIRAIPPPICDRPALREFLRLAIDARGILRHIQSGAQVPSELGPLLRELLEVLNSLRGPK